MKNLLNTLIITTLTFTGFAQADNDRDYDNDNDNRSEYSARWEGEVIETCGITFTGDLDGEIGVGELGFGGEAPVNPSKQVEFVIHDNDGDRETSLEIGDYGLTGKGLTRNNVFIEVDNKELQESDEIELEAGRKYQMDAFTTKSIENLEAGKYEVTTTFTIDC